MGSHLRSVKTTKQQIRDLMIVDERTGEKVFTAAVLFSIPVETGGSQA